MEQTDLLRYAVQVLERLNIPYAIVGSFASGVWGESRFTQDIDILIDLEIAQVQSLCASFPDADFYVSEPAAREAVTRHRQFNVLHPASGNKIDFMIAGKAGWAKAQIARRRRIELFPDLDARVAAPDDVILGKLIYYQEGGSEKHLRDIAGILKFSGDLIDHNYLSNAASQLGLSSIWKSISAGAKPT